VSDGPTSPTPDEAAELTTAAEIIASDYAHDEPSAELPSAARAILDAYEGVLAERDALRARVAELEPIAQRARDRVDPLCHCGGCGSCAADYILTGEYR